MYVYMTCRPDIGYAMTTLSTFSVKPSEYHYGLLKQIALYLRNNAYWVILTQEDYDKGFFPTTNYNVPDDPTLTKMFKININTIKLIAFVDAAYANDLHKQRSTTELVFTSRGGAIIYK